MPGERGHGADCRQPAAVSPRPTPAAVAALALPGARARATQWHRDPSKPRAPGRRPQPLLRHLERDCDRDRPDPESGSWTRTLTPPLRAGRAPDTHWQWQALWHSVAALERPSETLARTYQ